MAISLTTISYVGGQTAQITASTATNTTINFSLTGGSASTPAFGDLVIVSFATGSTADRTLAMVTSGYGILTASTGLYANDSFDTNLTVFYKKMGPTPDTSVVVGPTLATADGGAVTIQVFRNAQVANVPTAYYTTTATGTNGGAVNPPATATVTSANQIAVIIGATAAGVNLTHTASYLTNFVQQASAATTNRVQIGAGYVSVTSGATYDGAAWTPSTTANTMSWASLVLVLTPAISTYSAAFEDGTLNEVSTAQTNTSVVASEGKGSYSASATLDSTFPSGIFFTSAFDTTTLYGKFSVKVKKTANPAADVAVSVFNIDSTVGGAAQKISISVIFYTTGVMQLLVYNWSAGAYVGSGLTLTNDTWATVELDMIIGGGSTNSTLTTRINGTQDYTSTATNLGTVPLGQLNFLTYETDASLTGSVLIDDVDFRLVPIVAATGRPKVWSGSAWVQKPLKVWNGTAWVEKPVKRWNGSAWITIT